MPMEDYYKILGVSPTATEDEIKKAYRSLAMKHHPDRGGDQAKFKNISAAYETLGDKAKKAEYDQMRQGGPSFNFRGGGGFQDFSDVFGQGPFGAHFHDVFGRHPRMPKNRDLNIQCRISLLDSFQGKQLEATYTLPSGKHQNVVINLPAGVAHGDTIKYQGLGDDSIPQAPRGNLNVTVIVESDPNYFRNGNDLYTTLKINPIEAMIGCVKTVNLITGQEKSLTLNPGTQNGAEFAIANGGFSDPHRPSIRGRFVTVVEIIVPAVKDHRIIDQLIQLNEELNRKS